MATVVELKGLMSTGWFDDLIRNLVDKEILRSVELNELKPPLGTFGSSNRARFKARLETAAQLASVLSAALALYAASSGGVQTCTMTFSGKSTNATLVVPCASMQSPNFTKNLDGIISEVGGSLHAITIDPMPNSGVDGGPK